MEDHQTTSILNEPSHFAVAPSFFGAPLRRGSGDRSTKTVGTGLPGRQSDVCSPPTWVAWGETAGRRPSDRLDFEGCRVRTSLCAARAKAGWGWGPKTVVDWWMASWVSLGQGPEGVCSSRHGETSHAFRVPWGSGTSISHDHLPSRGHGVSPSFKHARVQVA